MKKVITIIIAIIIISAILVGCGPEEQNLREQALQEASSISSEIKKMDYIENRVNNSIPDNLNLYIPRHKSVHAGREAVGRISTQPAFPGQ